jgi:peptide/nickel transport system permease protein
MSRQHAIRRLILRRLLIAVPVLLGASVLIFAAGRIATPNPSLSALSIFATPAARAEFERSRHLNDPLVVQYALWLQQAVKGDFGRSIVSNEPVGNEVWPSVSVSVQLATGALVIAGIFGIGFGTLAGMRRGRASDRIVMNVSLLGVSFPAFSLGILFILLFSTYLGWLPAGGYAALRSDPIGYFKSMALPCLTLAVAPACYLMRVTRARVAEEAESTCARTATSLGITRRRVIQHYVLRNALVEPVTVLGIHVGYLLGGVVLIEQVFSLPGVGRLALLAANQGDFPVIQMTALLAVLAYIGTNLLVDVVHIFLERRLVP